MSSSPDTITISLPENHLWNLYGNYNTSIEEATKQENKTSNEPIVIQDIKDLYLDQVTETSYLASIGLVPSKSLFIDWQKKLLLASIFSVLSSIWISNQLVLSVFIILNIVNFITSLFTKKEILFKQKLAYFINEGLLIGLISAITEVLIGKIPIPFTPFSISIFYLSAFFMNIYYIYEIAIRLFSTTSLNKSRTLINFILSGRDVFKDWGDKFKERQEKEILNTKE